MRDSHLSRQILRAAATFGRIPARKSGALRKKLGVIRSYAISFWGRLRRSAKFRPGETAPCAISWAQFAATP